jgi:hypothetical protein
MMIIIGLVWVALLVSLPMAFVLARKRHHGKLVLAAGMALGGVAAAMAMRISFASDFANFLSVALAYFAYCIVVVCLWRIPNRVLRWTVIAVTAVPILVGYILATVGVLALMFIIGDETIPPSHHEVIPPNYTCTIRRWGNATSDSGYRVTLFQHWALLPFLRREAQSLMINESHPQPGHESSTCEDILQAYRNGR